MGHEFSRAAAATALIFGAAACGGGGGDGDPPPVLDNARDQVAAVTVPEGSASAGASVDDADDSELAASAPAELPAPDPSTFEGANRVVNLLVGDGGETVVVDVWGRRTFTNGPILLADRIGFGVASEYFSAPPGYELVIVGSGAGPDGEELIGVPNAAAGVQVTTVLTQLDDLGVLAARDLFEVGEQAPAASAPGTGLVVMYAPNFDAFSDRLLTSVGGDSFSVGDGSGACRVQRVEADGFSASVLGGTQPVELELPPGPATLSLHPWFAPDECDRPSALDITVDVVPDQTVLVLVYSRDGQSVESMTLSVEPVS